MYDSQKDIHVRIMDYYYGKVLYGKDIPIRGEGILDSIDQFSGQTFKINLFTEAYDVKRNKIYADDIVNVIKLTLDESSYEIERKIVGRGVVENRRAAYGVHIVKGQQEMKFIYLHDENYEFEVIGNYLENKELLL